HGCRGRSRGRWPRCWSRWPASPRCSRRSAWAWTTRPARWCSAWCWSRGAWRCSSARCAMLLGRTTVPTTARWSDPPPSYEESLLSVSESVSEVVTVTGHLMDSGILARVLDDVLGYGGDYRIERLEVGKHH